MPRPAVLIPGIYHGLNKKPPFFEGWYYKLVSADEQHKLAIIPGVILGQDAHAFVQVLDGVEGTAAYIIVPLQDFQGDAERFSVKIGASEFDSQHLKINLDDPECQLSGEIELGPFNPWPVTWLLPGVMGWFAWVPGMECYHGVLSFDHILQGKLRLNGREMDFSGGRGYIEKDWGKSFPAAWVWFQSNHFQNQRACITASVALIPWLGNAFKGFIVGFWHEGRLHRFTTYLNGKIERLEISDTHVTWVLRNRTHRLRLHAYRAEGTALRGPNLLDMGKRVIETLNASIHVRLETLQGEPLFDSIGNNAGLEVVGDLQRLIVSKL
ncbi:MAG: tocopherol cyclase family protein [Anaerolineaceae bacterium]